jgi:kynureninase
MRPAPPPVSPTLQPHVMRVAPVHLYNTAAEVVEFVATLKLCLAEGEDENEGVGEGAA